MTRRSLPPFDKLIDTYPRPKISVPDLKRQIGGAANDLSAPVEKQWLGGANGQPTGSRALGHVDLWDGETFFDEITGISSPKRDFFKIANGVALWLTDGKKMLPRA